MVATGLIAVPDIAGIVPDHAYRRIIKSRARNCYGEADEAISTGLGQLVATYQKAIGNGNKQVEAVSTGATSHSGAYATAAPQWKVWFDGLRWQTI